MQEHIVHVDSSNAHQFNVRTTNGNPDWYKDLKGCMTHNDLGAFFPGFTLFGCNFLNLDGDYWINHAGTNGNDEVWVEKSGAYAIYFTDSSTTVPTFCP